MLADMAKTNLYYILPHHWRGFTSNPSMLTARPPCVFVAPLNQMSICRAAFQKAKNSMDIGTTTICGTNTNEQSLSSSCSRLLTMRMEEACQCAQNNTLLYFTSSPERGHFQSLGADCRMSPEAGKLDERKQKTMME